MTPRRWITVLALAVVAVVLAASQRRGPVLADGTMIDETSWQLAEGLLPDEILAHYRKGEYRNRILDIDRPGLQSILPPPDFREAAAANRGRYRVDASGTVVDVSTGKRPTYVVGFPFPDVDPAAPTAGSEVVWNFFYATWYRGNSHFLNELVMLGRGGVERRIGTQVKMLFYDGAPELLGRPNPRDLQQQMLAKVVSPADLAGTVSLTWRYRDERPDALWTYVPGLRRARSISPLNRSDGFLGSDITLDDGPFFDGKPESFTFRLLGREEQLVLMDPFGIRGETELVPVPGGGWRVVWKDVPRMGADDPSWDGLPWAPVSSVLVRRPVWVVEARPKDPNYLYGRIVLRFDAETFRGTWASKYDRADVLVGSYQVSSGAYSHAPDGSWIAGGGTTVQTAENYLYDRATVVVFPARSPENPADFRVELDPGGFDADVLVRMGR
ncbi:MAG TPA: DUF1329 domain-containing protein [Actinomycetota bacterium]